MSLEHFTYLRPRCVLFLCVLAITSNVACSSNETKEPEASPAVGRAQEEPPVTEMQMLVIDAFYDNNPVTYEPEPREVTEARQRAARDRIKTLSDEQIQAVAYLLRDENATITECAAKTLEMLGEQAAPAVPQLVAALSRPGAAFVQTRLAIIRTLNNLGPAAAAAREPLEKHLQQAASQEQQAAREALARIAATDPAAPTADTRQLVQSINNFSTKNNTAAQQLVARGREAVPDLVQIVQTDPDDFVRRRALTVLGLIGPEAAEAVPILVEALDEQDSFSVSHVVEALGKIGPASAPAVGRLTEIIRDDDAILIKKAIEAVGQIGPSAEEAVSVLIEKLEGDDPFTGTAAAEALGKIGPAAAPAIPALRRAQNHPVIRDAAIEAQRKIQPDRDPLVAGAPDDPADKDKAADPAQAVPRAEMFYETLKSGDLPALRALLTQKARPNYGTGVGSASLDPPPTDAKITFGEPRFKDDMAVVPVAMDIDMKQEPLTYLYMRSEYGKWRVYALRLAGNNGEKIMVDFENPRSLLPDIPFQPGQDSPSNPASAIDTP